MYFKLITNHITKDNKEILRLIKKKVNKKMTAGDDE